MSDKSTVGGGGPEELELNKVGCNGALPFARSDSTDSVMSVTSTGSVGSISSTTSTTSTSSQRAKVYFCEYEGCDKSFTRPGLLTEHQMSVHHGVKPHKCDLCDKAFAKKSHLNRHMFSHSEEKPFQCSVCGKGVTTRQQLKRHEIVHTKSFHCPYDGCEESFYKHPQLRSHILSIHENKLTCPHCNKTFQRPYRLKNHIDKHHNPESAGKYQCDFISCTEVFSTWSALQQHIKETHPKLPCPVCKKPCVGKTGLKNHMIIHNDALVTKNWKCTVCSQVSFAKKSQLLQHYADDHKELDPLLLPTPSETVTSLAIDTENVEIAKKPKTIDDYYSSKKRKADELASVESEVKIQKYIESGKSAMSLLLNTIGQRRKCPYTNCNRSFKTKEKFDKHIEKHKIHDLKMKILEDENNKEKETHNTESAEAA